MAMIKFTTSAKYLTSHHGMHDAQEQEEVWEDSNATAELSKQHHCLHMLAETWHAASLVHMLNRQQRFQCLQPLQGQLATQVHQQHK